MPWLKKPNKKNGPRRKQLTEERKIAAGLYNTPTWRQLRTDTVRRLPYCAVCLCRLSGAVLTMAQEVHHLEPILSGIDDAQRATLAYSADNLAPLCRSCHRQIHTTGLRHVDEGRLWRLLDALHSGSSAEEMGALVTKILMEDNGKKEF